MRKPQELQYQQRKAAKDIIPWGIIKHLLVQEGEEVSHHYKDRPGQSKE